MFAMLPVNALRTFESAARLRSFKLAAAELTVTPTAISHQIKALEQQLGFALFERVPRGVRLTPKGETLFAGVHGALLDVAATLEACGRSPAPGRCASRSRTLSRRCGWCRAWDVSTRRTRTIWCAWRPAPR